MPCVLRSKFRPRPDQIEVEHLKKDIIRKCVDRDPWIQLVCIAGSVITQEVSPMIIDYHSRRLSWSLATFCRRATCPPEIDSFTTGIGDARRNEYLALPPGFGFLTGWNRDY